MRRRHYTSERIRLAKEWHTRDAACERERGAGSCDRAVYHQSSLPPSHGPPPLVSHGRLVARGGVLRLFIFGERGLCGAPARAPAVQPSRARARTADYAARGARRQRQRQQQRQQPRRPTWHFALHRPFPCPRQLFTARTLLDPSPLRRRRARLRARPAHSSRHPWHRSCAALRKAICLRIAMASKVIG